MKQESSNIYWLLVIALLLISCGDLFNPKRKIVANYYLVEGDTKSNQSICYKTGEDYIVKIPSQVIEYGYSDSFLVAKTQDYKKNISYYIIDRTKDFDLAHEENFRIGPVSRQEFLQKWRDRLNIKLETCR